MQTSEHVSRYDRIMADIRAGKSDEYLIDTYKLDEIGAVKVYRMVCDGTISPGRRCAHQHDGDHARRDSAAQTRS